MEPSISKALHSANTARTYPTEVSKLRAAFEEAVRGLPRWTLNSSPENEVRAVRKTRLGLKDDVVVRLAEIKTGAHKNTRAELTSGSRVGLYDLGQNGRNLRELLAAVDRELNAGSD